jgi:hypothetical protein
VKRAKPVEVRSMEGLGICAAEAWQRQFAAAKGQ